MIIKTLGRPECDARLGSPPVGISPTGNEIVNASSNDFESFFRIDPLIETPADL